MPPGNRYRRACHDGRRSVGAASAARYRYASPYCCTISARARRLLPILPRHPGHEARSVELASAVCKRLRVPIECRDLALLVARHHGDVHRAGQLAPAEIVRLLENTDALRRPERFEQLLEACTCDFQGRLGWQDAGYPAAPLLRQALLLARGIDAAAIAGSCPEPAEIGARIHAARVAALAPLVKPGAETAPVQRT
jgi:tRNA nucleotidyltransferase (CCA-adding enzyme)